MASEQRRDELARAAATLVHQGRAADLAEAMDAVAERFAASPRDIPVGRVREHLRGMAMEELGLEGYRWHVATVLERAEELMTLISLVIGEDLGKGRVAVVGRAARGQVDGDPRVRLRVESDIPIERIAEAVVAAGYPEPRFETLECRSGRLSCLVVDDDEVEMRIVRCPRSMNVPMDRDLVHGQPIASIDLRRMRSLIAALRDVTSPPLRGI